MNIHPMLVHFPIALLSLYSVLEIVGYLWPTLRRQTWFFPANAVLLFVGVLGAIAAYAAGGVAEEIVGATNPRIFIVEVHDPFALATTILYLVLAAGYLVRVLDKKGWSNRMLGLERPFMRIWSIKKYLAHIVLDTWLLPLIALIALVCLLITGALGAAITYGPDIDPFVSFIYHLFWAQ